MNPNVSLNQFALPGMEEHAHPLARHLAKGVTFEHETDLVRKGPGNVRWDLQRAEPYEHHLLAHQDSHFLAQLNWAGSAQHRNDDNDSGHYPGEITWVENNSPRLSPKGLVADMFKTGHEVNFGQSTVPVHSPDRTVHGEKWSANVGDPSLRPSRYDFSYRPPAGIHPYEQQRNLQSSQFTDPHQQRLPGLSAVDLQRQNNEYWTKKHAEEDEEMRRNGEPF